MCPCLTLVMISYVSQLQFQGFNYVSTTMKMIITSFFGIPRYQGILKMEWWQKLNNQEFKANS